MGPRSTTRSHRCSPSVDTATWRRPWGAYVGFITGGELRLLAPCLTFTREDQSRTGLPGLALRSQRRAVCGAIQVSSGGVSQAVVFLSSADENRPVAAPPATSASP